MTVKHKNCSMHTVKCGAFAGKGRDLWHLAVIRSPRGIWRSLPANPSADWALFIAAIAAMESFYAQIAHDESLDAAVAVPRKIDLVDSSSGAELCLSPSSRR